MDQSRGCGVAHTAAAAAAVVVEQEIVRVVQAAAVDPRGQTAHLNQARPLEPNSKGKLASLIIFKGLQCKKIVTELYLNVLTFSPPDWAMLRRSRRVLIFSLKTYLVCFPTPYKVRSAAAEILRVPHYFCRGTSRTSFGIEF